MADALKCPICQKVGFVRVESEVQRETSRRIGRCGACNNSWPTTDEGRPVRAMSLGEEWGIKGGGPSK